MTNARALGLLADLYLAIVDKPDPTADERAVMAAIQAALEARTDHLAAIAAAGARGELDA